MPHVLARLWKSADEICIYLKYKEVQCCLPLKSILKLYMKVQIFHALKRCNVQINGERTMEHNREKL